MEKKKINAQIVADSVNPQGDRIITFLLTYPRFIHGELMTHRMFSRNSASSRAIPFEKMLKMVQEDPFIPIAWQKDHKGMQGTEYITDLHHSEVCREDWLAARDAAVHSAIRLNSGFRTSERDKTTADMAEEDWEDRVSKQLCNRLLEPFMWHTTLVTATEWDNFFELRCPQYYYEPENKYFKSRKDYSNYWFENFGSGIEGAIEVDPTIWWLEQSKSSAEIHIQTLAEAMWNAMNESIPNQLEAGEWHIPFGDNIDFMEAFSAGRYIAEITSDFSWGQEQTILNSVKVATARCARLSYMTFDGEINYEKDIKLHNKLLESRHGSPFEHCARAMNEEEYNRFFKGEIPSSFVNNPSGLGWCNNFRGFIPYRYLIENEN